ncbi:tRNA 2-thiouridine(34) synthase MnmA, partial [Patescibacteria group bacterium]|nr:tRNA 2-thiouridine(34) synthase MnmA [Patescibacteria group bacterium]
MKVAVGLSGGVDSALAAALLKEQGYQVTGVFLECWNEPGCRTDNDRKDALKVALKLKFPFRVLDFKKEYRQRVMALTYREFKAGRTPNPDILCNREIKFGLFLDWSIKQGFDLVATGHYAQLKKGKLYQSVDKNKDQTYFLALLKEKQLRQVLFPIGHLLKSQVRRQARQRGFHVWSKKDSTGICFIGHDLPFKEFLKRKIKPHPGDVVDRVGQVIGRHEGVEFYTIGQRHGFRVATKNTASQPLFVIQKDIKSNRLIVGNKQDLAKKEFQVEGWSWINQR